MNQLYSKKKKQKQKLSPRHLSSIIHLVAQKLFHANNYLQVREQMKSIWGDDKPSLKLFTWYIGNAYGMMLANPTTILVYTDGQP